MDLDPTLNLALELAKGLAMPVFLVDTRGDLLFYNLAAEPILGQRFAETGRVPASVWSTSFTPTDARGQKLPPAELPLVIALEQKRPSHKMFWIKGLDGRPRRLEVTALPLIDSAGNSVGAVAIFWDVTHGA